MDFNSYLFVLLILPITIIVYFLLNSSRHYNAAKVYLLLVSLFFYGFANPLAIIAIVLDILINYLISTFCFTNNLSVKFRQLFLFSGIAFNILALAYFKYTGFISDIFSSISKGDYSFKSIFIPLGISYITFSQIAYLVDTYRDISIKYSILDYSLFILFFPKVTVGPIAFSTELIPQFNDSLRKEINYDNIAKGLTAFVFGLAKKVLLADNLSNIVNWGYDNLIRLNSIESAVVILAYTMQIYFDFSGFCDMAQGICVMLNIDLPVNFDSPYKALSINEFWKKWHITLTRFLRQYVYFPLGGNRKGTIRTYINIFIIFLLSGLWHGASYTFIVWGCIHGIFMCLSKAFSNISYKLPKAIRFIFTFIYINITWIFFRASTLQDALLLIKRLLTGGISNISIEMAAAGTPIEGSFIQWLIIELTGKTPYITATIMTLSVLLFSVCASTLLKNTNERINTFKPTNRSLIITVLLFAWCILSLSQISQFIYVNF